MTWGKSATRFTEHTAPDGALNKAIELDRLAGFHECSCDDGTLVLRLQKSSLRRVDSFVREGIEREPDALEIGGILIGTVAPDGSIVTLLDVIPIEIEDRSDPEFRPSDADAAKFADAIAEYSQGRRRVIGYFRSDLRATPSLRAEDEILLRRVFNAGGCSILLVHANPAGQSASWFCQWDGRNDIRVVSRLRLASAQAMKPVSAGIDRRPRIAAEPELKPAVEPQELRPSPRIAKPERQSDTALGPPSPVGPPPTIGPPPWERENFPGPARPDPRRPRFLSLRNILIAAATVIAIFALGRVSVLRRSASEAIPLNLTVEEHGSMVDVKWNPASFAVRDSARGALDIVDGANVVRFDLNQTQLLAGHYEYVPVRPDLTCLMTVYQKDNVFVGETQHVHMNRTQSAGLDSLPEQTPQAAAIHPTTAPRQAIAAVASSGVPAAGLPAGKLSRPQGSGEETLTTRMSTADSDPASSSEGAAVRTPRRSFMPPAATARTTPAPRLEQAPELRAAESSPASSVLPGQGLPSNISAPVRPLPAPVTLAKPVTASSPSSTVASTLLAFSEAVATTRITPTVPQGIRSEIRREVSIRVAVQIGQDGRVTGAHALDSADLLERMLSPYATQAARLWRFNPARRSGSPVASETVLTFQFAKNL